MEEYIKELKEQIYKFGPQWNIFGTIDKMKYLINNIEKLHEYNNKSKLN